MVGMRDVAKAAGVSLSTVSLVVNGTGYVSDDMRERVESAMRQLDYVPNELARNFYHDRTGLIGVIVPTIIHPFFSMLTAALQHALAVRGYRTLVCSQADSETGEAEYIDMLQRHMMDGIIMAAHTSHAPGYWTSIGRPIVAFDRYLGEGISSIGSDHVQGGQLIAEQLIRTGARHVVCVGGPRRQFHDLPGDSYSAGSDSGNGYQKASSTTFPTIRYYLTLEYELNKAQIRHDYVEVGEVYDLQRYQRMAHEIFEHRGDIDAIVGSDVSAAYCIQEALRLGIHVPGQLQIIAYDDSYLAEAAGMRITAIRQDFTTLAQLTSERIIREIRGGDDDVTRTAPAEAGKEPSDGSFGASADASRGAAAHLAGTRPLDTVVPVRLRVGETTRT
ncbi:MAG: LacI family DNA-binding transcriptional regulator [Bifidobacterium sp.]|jgi:LacI family sucrose operon transcriptional repressor|nr:LacI family DNA-binding transcriptional regulator [Bifidobacterium sp.]